LDVAIIQLYSRGLFHITPDLIGRRSAGDAWSDESAALAWPITDADMTDRTSV